MKALNLLKCWRSGKAYFLARSTREKNKIIAVTVAAIILGCVFYHPHRIAALSAGPNSASSTADCVDATGVGTVTWTSPGNAFSSDNTYATASVDGTTTHYIKCTNFGFSIPSGATVVGIVVGVERKSSSTSNGGSNDAAVRIVKAGVIGTTDRATATTYTTTDTYEDHGGSSDTWGDSFTGADVDGSTFGAAVAVTKASAAGAAHTVSVDHIRITVYYTLPPPIMAITGYSIENDDGADVNSDAVQAASSFSTGQTVSNVKKGERLTLRFQVKNTGGSASANTLGLFYDRGDGIWTKVRQATAPTTGSGSGCADSAWTCTAVDTANTVGQDTSIAFDTLGNPWVSYVNATNSILRVARYVGSGGSGCAGSAWTCSSVDTSSLVTSITSIALDQSGNPWISYYGSSGGDLRAAHYVGTGGTGCASTAWTCTAVDTTNDVGQYNSLTLDSSGNPWISYIDTTNADVRVAHYVGTGGTGCASTAWICTAVDTANSVNSNTSITVDSSGNPWISYWNSSTADLWAAHYVGSGGSGCASTAWTCTVVDNSALSVGTASSMALDKSGNPWISYFDSSNDDLKVASYVGTGGTGCASTAWICTAVDASNTGGQDTSIAFDASGSAWVSNFDNVNGDLRVAHYVGSGGSGCANTAWNCTAVDTANTVGQYTSIAFDASDNPWVSYNDNTNGDLRVAHISRAGEITMSPGLSGANGDSLTSSHSDMTSAGDSADKADTDCVGGGTWNNGNWYVSPEGNFSLPDGSSTAQCTEVAFTIDTSQAVAGNTYRFMVATKNNWRADKGEWRGPNSISAYPQLTIESSAASPYLHYSKDKLPEMAACASGAWSCTSVETTNNVGYYASTAFDPNGNPWVSYYDGTNLDLRVAQYVGTGGSGCASTAWTCTAVDSANDVGYLNSIAFDPSGKPWISYRDNTNSDLRVAQYVGSGGSGCASTAWTCVAVDATNNVGNNTSLAFDPSGNPWVSYIDATNSDLKIAHYVGSGGSGCSSTAWTCTSVDTAPTVIGATSISVDNAGDPWVSYFDSVNGDLKIAQYVGSGGSGCAVTSWTCTAVDTANTVGQYNSIAIDGSGNPWVSYYDNTNGDLRIARFVGSGGSGCAVTSWTCTSVDTANTVGQNTSIAFDSSGNPWVSYYDTTNLDMRVAQYVGSGGAGCAVTSWTCTAIDTVNDVGASNTSIAFDASGSPWVSYQDNTNKDLRVAKLNSPPSKPVSSSSYAFQGRNSARSSGRYDLDRGKAPSTDADGTCSVTASYAGYCGLSIDDTNFDSVAAGANERPLYNFSVRHGNNTDSSTASWIGKSTVAASSKNILLQVFNVSSGAWETVTTNTACSANTDCTITGTPSGSVANYYDADGANYWIYWRVYQVENSSAETLSSDYFNAYSGGSPVAPTTDQFLRGGGYFSGGSKQSYYWAN